MIGPSNNRNFMGNNVYVALRPKLTQLMGLTVPNEHITIEYLGDNVSYNEVLTSVTFWHHALGIESVGSVQVHVNGFANWFSGKRFYNVALINFPDRPELSYKKNWHLTVEKSYEELEAIPVTKWDIENLYDSCDQLYVGYDNEDGNQQWLSSRGLHAISASKNHPSTQGSQRHLQSVSSQGF